MTSQHKKEFPIKGFTWVWYIFGWITGAGNALFWLIMALLYMNKKEKKFFNNNFHKRVAIWGMIMAIASVALLFLILLVAVITAKIGSATMN
ncbi:hypothetical protein GF342_02960 [Candidatus Woesearchaeota archaeon]|nr:hypothetical protein [Candidatus Woesearchaeota archaeon]